MSVLAKLQRMDTLQYTLVLIDDMLDGTPATACIRIHAYMHILIYAYMHTCIHVYAHTRIHAYTLMLPRNSRAIERRAFQPHTDAQSHMALCAAAEARIPR